VLFRSSTVSPRIPGNRPHNAAQVVW